MCLMLQFIYDSNQRAIETFETQLSSLEKILLKFRKIYQFEEKFYSILN